MEGPSIVILREELKPFVGKKVLEVSGNSKQPKESLQGKTLKSIQTWGKVIFLIFSGNIVTRTHFLLFGSYRIDEPKEGRDPRVELKFETGTVYFYSCSFLMEADQQLQALDQRVNVLGEEWNEKHVVKLLSGKEQSYLCDLFLDQSLFSGSGNIIKNEVLFNLRRHPLTRLEEIPKADWKKLVHAIRIYCENFYEWKKRYELRKHWQVYRRFKCKVCESKLNREKLGRTMRGTFYCPVCQSKAKTAEKLKVHSVLPIASDGVREERIDH